ncbi:MAG: hypothetical protein IJA52_00320 [Clostridia bacterium]|nr:hypothetical protein [Clostridia bacterium]
MSLIRGFKRICREKYSEYGFVNHNQTFARITNDVLQTFTLKRLSCGFECTVEFAIVPLCIGIKYPDLGTLELHQMLSEYSEFRYDKHSDKSVENCLVKIFEAIDTYLIPMFHKAVDCKSAFDCLIEVKHLCEENRLMHLQRKGIENCAEPFNKRILYDHNCYYMALKNSNYDYVKKYLETVLSDKKEYVFQRLKEIGEKDALSSTDNSIKNVLLVIKRYEELLEKLNSGNYGYFDEMIYENERSSLTALEAYKMYPIYC